MKEKRNPHPGKPPNQQKDQLSQRDLQDSQKSATACLRTKNKSERRRDHLNHWHRRHSLRCSGGGWALRLMLWRSVPGSRLALVVWRQPKGLQSSMLRAGEWKAMAEGTREKVQTCRRDKVPLLGRGEEEGQAAIENSLGPSVHACPPYCRELSFPSQCLYQGCMDPVSPAPSLAPSTHAQPPRIQPHWRLRVLLLPMPCLHGAGPAS